MADDGEKLEAKTDQQSSIKVSRNAKGDYAFEVKVYHDDAAEVLRKLSEYVAGVKERIAEEIVEETNRVMGVK